MSQLTDIGEEIKSKSRAIIPLLRRNANQCDSMGKLNDEVLRAMDDAGIWKMATLKEFGGYGPLPSRDIFEIIIEIGRGNASAAWCAIISLLAAEQPPKMFSDEVCRELFGSDHIGPRFSGASFNVSYAAGRARKVDGGYMIKGSWAFASNVRISEWQMAGATVYDDKGDPQERIISYIPRHKFKIADDWRVEGMRATSSNSAYTLEEIFVPERLVYTFDNENDRAPTQDRGSGAAALARGRKTSSVAGANMPDNTILAGLCAVAVGGAYGALDVFKVRAGKRKPLGQIYPTILSMPTTHVTMAKVRTIISLCEAAMHRIFDMEEGIIEGLRGSHDEAERETGPADVAYTACYTVNAMSAAIDELQRLIGASTASVTDDVGRFARDIKVESLHGIMRLDWVSERYGARLAGMPKVEVNAGTGDTRPLTDFVELVDA
ncbi:MAG TPA: hypothetical protein VJ859_06415 [Allosphingosinicella sp.]|nr:hypothetical protein [Allosphingosinicella sp.]